jgi:hypothetical protein
MYLFAPLRDPPNPLSLITHNGDLNSEENNNTTDALCEGAVSYLIHCWLPQTVDRLIDPRA